MEDMEEIDTTSLPSRNWSLVRIGWYSAIVVFVFFAVQVLAVAVGMMILVAANSEPDVEAWSSRLGSDGSFLAWSTIATTICCSPLVVYLASRRESEPWQFLRLVPTNTGLILKWCLAIAAFILISDTLTIALGRSAVPQFMIDVYHSAAPILLFVALVVAAPLFEELFFRGFLIGALESAGVRMSFSAVFTSLAWAVIHTQYDVYGILTIFFMGILTIFFMGMVLALARYRTRSLVPCLAMHALANAIAFTEAAVAAA